MSLSLASTTYVPTASPRLTVGKKWIDAILGFGVFLGGFVIHEPAPYELYAALIMALFVLGGLKFGRLPLLLMLLFVTFNVGGLFSMLTMSDYKNIPLYLAVSLFLGLTAVFWSVVIAADMGRLRIIFRGFVAAGLITALAGIAGYFHLFPGAEIFTRYNRAMGIFQDPNVFGPFLITPILYLVYGILYRDITISIARMAILAVMLFGLFLSFSRGAWGGCLLSGSIFYALLILSETSARKRSQLIVVAALGLMAAALLLVFALQFDAVGDMFSERAKVVQDYDGQRLGRFARHAIGFEWALENPLGIGPMEFGIILDEDTHNIWVKSLMAYGWIGFVAWFSIIVTTLVAGGRLVLRKRPWQPFLMCAWSAFVAHLFLGWVIDMDHWRHFYLLIGIIWGCMALEMQYRQQQQHVPVKM